jgi:hypothetical protein
MSGFYGGWIEGKPCPNCKTLEKPQPSYAIPTPLDVEIASMQIDLEKEEVVYDSTRQPSAFSIAGEDDEIPELPEADAEHLWKLRRYGFQKEGLRPHEFEALECLRRHSATGGREHLLRAMSLLNRLDIDLYVRRRQS